MQSWANQIGRGVAVVLVTLAGVQSGAVAAPLVKASSSTSYGGAAFNSAPTGTVSDAEETTEVGLYATGRTTASGKVLKAFANAQAGGQNRSLYSIFTFNSAEWRDDWTIDKAGLTGTAGTLRVKFTIDGKLTTAFSGDAQSSIKTSSYAAAGFGFGQGVTGDELSYRNRGDGTSSGTNFFGVEQVRDVPFTFGQTLTNITLRISANASANAEYQYAFSGTSDLEHTANWGGFVDVRDASGNVVTGYNFTSAAGVDYTTAVPEPTALAALALGGVTLLRRRR